MNELENKTRFTSHWWSIIFVLFFPLLIMSIYSDFIRHSEFNSRLGWFLLLGGIAYIFRKTWLKKVLLGVLFLFIVSGSMDILYAVTFGGVFSKDSFKAFLLTDSGEAIEFIYSYISFQNISLLIIYWVIGYYLIKNILFKEPQKIRERVFVGLGFLMIIVAFQQIFVHDRIKDTIPGFTGVAIEFGSGHERREALIEKRKKLDLKSSYFAEARSDSHQTYVVVIGESLNRNHMSLYGYSRDTSPFLKSIHKELIKFDDVISNYAQTRPSINVALTEADILNKKNFSDSIGLVELFRKSGFDVSWISNQSPGQPLATNSDYERYLSNEFFGVNVERYDGYLITYIKEALSRESKKKVIFVHLMGSHLQYRNRYPEEKSFFQGSEGVNAYRLDLLESELSFINSYDDSVRYTDSVMQEILYSLQSLEGIAALSLWSDHGEEVFDVKAFKGHGPDGITKNMFEVPFIFWRNDAYIKEFPKVDELLRSHTDSPIMLDDFFHIAQCMFPLDSDLLDISKSLCETEYDSKPRMVYGKNYDKELK